MLTILNFFIILLITFSSGIMAKEKKALSDLGSEKNFVDQLFKKSEILKSYDEEMNEIYNLKSTLWGQYDTFFNVDTLMYEDKSEQDSSYAPYDLNVYELEFSLNKMWPRGIKSKLFYSYNYKSFKTFTIIDFTSPPRNLDSDKIRNEIGAEISVSILRNFWGKVDQILIDNLKDDQILLNMGREKKIESYLFISLNQYFNCLLSRYNKYFAHDIVKNAKKLLNITLDRRSKGIIDNRELYIYKSNLTSAKQQLLNAKISHEQLLNEVRFLVDNPRFFLKKKGLLTLDKSENEVIKSLSTRDLGKLARNETSVTILEKETIISSRLIDSYRVQKRPSLELVLSAKGIGNVDGGRYSYGDSLEDAHKFRKPIYSIGAFFSLPIGNDLAKRRLDQAKAAFMKKNYEYADKLRKTHFDLISIRDRIIKLKELLSYSKKHEKNEKMKFDNEIKEFHRARSDAQNIVRFQNEYLKARISHIRNIINLKLSIREYLYMVNDLVKFYHINVD